MTTEQQEREPVNAAEAIASIAWRKARATSRNTNSPAFPSRLHVLVDGCRVASTFTTD